MEGHEVHEQDPLNDAPMLRSLHREHDPFKVPDGFFMRFPHAVQLRAVKSGSTAGIGLWQGRPAWSLALGLLVIAVVMWMVLPEPADHVEVAVVEEHQELDVLPDELPVSDQLVWEVYADPDRPLFGEVMIDLEEHELVAYLERENVDIELLMTEL